MDKLRIAVVGAGAAYFPRPMIVDLLSHANLREADVVLHDVDQARLDSASAWLDRVIARHRLPAGAHATTDMAAAIDGADYVIVAFQVGGFEAWKTDVEIPRRYGLDYIVGDTMGPAGIFRGMRTGVVLEQLAAEVRARAPHALVVNFANPLSMHCWILRDAGVNVVGLCQGMHESFANLVSQSRFEPEQLTFRGAGINHFGWITELSHDGEDVYAEVAAAHLARNPRPDVLDETGRRKAVPGVNWEPYEQDPGNDDLVRAEILRCFGAFLTECSPAVSEYMPWFRKSEALTKAYVPRRWDPMKGHEGRSADPEQVARNENRGMDELTAWGSEWAAMVSALAGGEPVTLPANVPNQLADGGLAVANLAADAIVEVVCRADATGLHPEPFGELPAQLAAITSMQVNCQRLAVHAAVHGDRDAAFQAIALDPFVSAQLTLPEIEHMVNALFEAEARWLPQFAAAGAVA